MHYGHGWIMGKDGKRWHPSRDQSVLLNGLSTAIKPTLFGRAVSYFGRFNERK